MAVAFLNERDRRLTKVRTYFLSDKNPSSKCIRRPAADLNAETLLRESPHPNPQQAPLWQPDDFAPASLSRARPFWRSEILKESTVEEWDTIMGWLNGVSVHAFVDENASGSFQGREYTSAELTAAEFSNHVPVEHEARVDGKVQKLVYQGSTARVVKSRKGIRSASPSHGAATWCRAR